VGRTVAEVSIYHEKSRDEKLTVLCAKLIIITIGHNKTSSHCHLSIDLPKMSSSSSSHVESIELQVGGKE
jgi:hypothetical protein